MLGLLGGLRSISYQNLLGWAGVSSRLTISSSWVRRVDLVSVSIAVDEGMAGVDGGSTLMYMCAVCVYDSLLNLEKVRRRRGIYAAQVVIGISQKSRKGREEVDLFTMSSLVNTIWQLPIVPAIGQVQGEDTGYKGQR